MFSPFDPKGRFTGGGAGISDEHQLAFGFGASLAQPTEWMMRTIRAMLTIEPVPKTEELSPNCFYSLAGQAKNLTGAKVRQRVLLWLANSQNLRTLAGYVVDKGADHVALCLALRGDAGPSADPGSLAQRVVASAIDANIRVAAGESTVTVEPLRGSAGRTHAARVAAESSSTGSSSSRSSSAMDADEESDWSPRRWDAADLVEFLRRAEPALDAVYYRQLVENVEVTLDKVLPALLKILEDERCLLNAVATAAGIGVTIEHVMAVWLSVGHSLEDVNAADWRTLRTICRVLDVSGAVVLDEHHQGTARWGRRPGAAVIRRVGTRYLAETEIADEMAELEALLNNNNCLLNAIAESKRKTLTFEQIVEIRMRLESIGTMLVASPQTLKIICEVLDIDGVQVHYPYPAPPEDWGSDENPAIISHTGFLHFVAGATQPTARTEQKKESKGKGKQRL